MSEEISIQDAKGATHIRSVCREGWHSHRNCSCGRTTRGTIEDSMLSPETLAKTLLLQLHQEGRQAS
jgi:hypothetical protein